MDKKNKQQTMTIVMAFCFTKTIAMSYSPESHFIEKIGAERV